MKSAPVVCTSHRLGHHHTRHQDTRRPPPKTPRRVPWRALPGSRGLMAPCPVCPYPGSSPRCLVIPLVACWSATAMTYRMTNGMLLAVNGDWPTSLLVFECECGRWLGLVSFSHRQAFGSGSLSRRFQFLFKARRRREIGRGRGAWHSL